MFWLSWGTVFSGGSVRSGCHGVQHGGGSVCSGCHGVQYEEVVERVLVVMGYSMKRW